LEEEEEEAREADAAATAEEEDEEEESDNGGGGLDLAEARLGVGEWVVLFKRALCEGEKRVQRQSRGETVV
jgi:hypothetical protein